MLRSCKNSIKFIFLKMNFLFIHNRKKKTLNLIEILALSCYFLVVSGSVCLAYGIFYFSFMLKGIPVKNVICLILKRNN